MTGKKELLLTFKLLSLGNTGPLIVDNENVGDVTSSDSESLGSDVSTDTNSEKLSSDELTSESDSDEDDDKNKKSSIVGNFKNFLNKNLLKKEQSAGGNFMEMFKQFQESNKTIDDLHGHIGGADDMNNNNPTQLGEASANANNNNANANGEEAPAETLVMLMRIIILMLMLMVKNQQPKLGNANAR